MVDRRALGEPSNVALEDESGLCNLVLTPDVFAAHRTAIVGAPALFAEGRLEIRDGVTNLRVERVERLLPAGEERREIPSRDFH